MRGGKHETRNTIGVESNRKRRGEHRSNLLSCLVLSCLVLSSPLLSSPLLSSPLLSSPLSALHRRPLFPPSPHTMAPALLSRPICSPPPLRWPACNTNTKQDKANKSCRQEGGQTDRPKNRKKGKKGKKTQGRMRQGPKESEQVESQVSWSCKWSCKWRERRGASANCGTSAGGGKSGS